MLTRIKPCLPVLSEPSSSAIQHIPQMDEGNLWVFALEPSLTTTKEDCPGAGCEGSSPIASARTKQGNAARDARVLVCTSAT